MSTFSNMATPLLSPPTEKKSTNWPRIQEQLHLEHSAHVKENSSAWKQAVEKNSFGLQTDLESSNTQPGTLRHAGESKDSNTDNLPSHPIV